MIPPKIAAALVEAGRSMDMRGWVPGSAGNLSARLDDNWIAITRSGTHKGKLSADTDIVVVDYEGRPAVVGNNPSAETLLHCQLYRLFPPIGAVLHGHSVAVTVLSQLGNAISFSGYELLKAFGFPTHEVEVPFPVYENNQDISNLVELIEPTLKNSGLIGYALAGHGVYAWGTNVEHALWRLEALEFLIACELEKRKIK